MKIVPENEPLPFIPKERREIMRDLGGEFYLSREDASIIARDDRYRHFRKAFSTLFFNGGSLRSVGLKHLSNVSKDHSSEAMASVRMLMESFAPPHEIKIETVAYAMSKWFAVCEIVADPIPEPRVEESSVRVSTSSKPANRPMTRKQRENAARKAKYAAV